MSSGESPMGTAKGKQPITEALCPPPPLWKALRCVPAWHRPAALGPPRRGPCFPLPPCQHGIVQECTAKAKHGMAER